MGAALNVPRAVNWAELPGPLIVWLAGISVIPVRSRVPGVTPPPVPALLIFTSRVELAVTRPFDPSMVAVMEVVPSFTAVATPAALMVAVPELLEAHVTCAVISRVSEGCLPCE